MSTTIKSIPTEVWECAHCKFWAVRLPVSWQGCTGDKDWQCRKCGCTSIHRRGPGRPFGPRSGNWKMLLAWEEIAHDNP